MEDLEAAARLTPPSQRGELAELSQHKGMIMHKLEDFISCEKEFKVRARATGSQHAGQASDPLSLPRTVPRAAPLPPCASPCCVACSWYPAPSFPSLSRDGPTAPPGAPPAHSTSVAPILLAQLCCRLRFLQAVVEANPSNTIGWNMLGLCLASQGKIEVLPAHGVGEERSRSNGGVWAGAWWRESGRGSRPPCQ